MKVKLFDTTLRDGAQGEGISLSVEDKLKITQVLDELGIHYIEGGWPGSNPKDELYFKKAKALKLRKSRLTAFGSTRRKGIAASHDANLKAIIDVKTPVACIFGKSWDFHVRTVLKVSLKKNLELIEDTIRFLRSRRRRVFYDAEHFFDGYRENPDHALATLKAAASGGASRIILCDTNGGSMMNHISEAVDAAREAVDTPLGIHVHNDSGLATANTLLAVERGVMHVQGTINGYGERCGNADLCVIIPNLCLKMRMRVVTDAQLRKLRAASHNINELANKAPRNNQPYVGHSAFAHKGGWHADAVQKDPRTCEHIEPGRVGNHRRVLVSELAGKGSIAAKAKSIGLDIDGKDQRTKELVQRLKSLEEAGGITRALDVSRLVTKPLDVEELSGAIDAALAAQ